MKRLASNNPLYSLMREYTPRNQELSKKELGQHLKKIAFNYNKNPHFCWEREFSTTDSLIQIAEQLSPHDRNYGQIHFEDITFTDEFSLAYIIKKFPYLVSISFCRCSFLEGFYYDSGENIFLDFQQTEDFSDFTVMGAYPFPEGKIKIQSPPFDSLCFNLSKCAPVKTIDRLWVRLLAQSEDSLIEIYGAQLDEFSFCPNVGRLMIRDTSIGYCSIGGDGSNGGSKAEYGIKGSSRILNLTSNVHGDDVRALNTLIIDGEFDERGVVIQNLYLSNVRFGIGIEINSASFYGTFDISNSIIPNYLLLQHSDFFQPLNTLGTKFPANTSFHDANFLDKKSHNSVALYREMRVKMHALGDEQQSSLFQAYEFESRYNTFLQSKSILDKEHGAEKMSSFILSKVHNYGIDLWQPLIWLLCTFLLFFSVYGIFTMFDRGLICVGDIPQGTWLHDVCSVPYGLPITQLLSYSLGPLGLLIKSSSIYPANVLIKTFEVLQLMISSLLWFFFIVSLRRRFKV